MNSVLTLALRIFRKSLLPAVLFAVCMAFSPVLLQAQTPQLSLADLLIALRSKKVSLPERNKILTEAVNQRGITFALTPEIEKELAVTGASTELLTAIKQKLAVVKPEPKPVATPIPTPTPPDYSFYQKRADTAAGKGEFTLALADYNKAAELKNDVSSIFLNRGRTHYNLKSYDQSVADYDRAIELNPKDAAAFYSRGESYERIGNKEKALADYQKAADLDTESEVAKASVKRLQDEIAKANAKPEPVKQVPAVVAPPEFLNLGNLTSANATRMVTPTYPLTAQRTGIEGRVTVEVELDIEGKVVSAKATSGHQMLRSAAEDAAKRSRFTPATFNGVVIKAKGVIQYNFNLKAGK